MENKEYKYRLGFKSSIKNKWDYTFWRLNQDLGDFHYSFESFIKALVSKMDCNPLFLKIERRDAKEVDNE